MHEALIRAPQGFENGYTALVRAGEEKNSLMTMGIIKLLAHEHFAVQKGLETAVLLLKGSVLLSHNDGEHSAERRCFFKETPIALHLHAGDSLKISAKEASELLIVQTENDKQFASTYFNASNMVENEHRGRGLLDDTAYRMVRTIFDYRNRPEAHLVLGEVLTLPGRWSSYPPHHHEQPEIYRYRFSEAQGYGHAELGEQVLKIKNYDTIKIFNEEDHAQVAAPGYAMMYVWAIRHLPNNPYLVPTFTKEHDWTRHNGANERVWRP